MYKFRINVVHHVHISNHKCSKIIESILACLLMCYAIVEIVLTIRLYGIFLINTRIVI